MFSQRNTDQLVHLSSLIRVFAGRSLEGKYPKYLQDIGYDVLHSNHESSSYNVPVSIAECARSSYNVPVSIAECARSSYNVPVSIAECARSSYNVPVSIAEYARLYSIFKVNSI